MRLVFVTLYTSSFMLFSYYSAAFITDLTLQDPALPFTNFEEFLEDGSYMLGMTRSSIQMDYFKVSYLSQQSVYDEICVQVFINADDGHQYIKRNSFWP
jgi:hypothetical protein